MQSNHDDVASRLLTTGEAAGLVGVSVDTIKRWEKAGHITSGRTPNGHRRFRRSDVERLLKPSSSAPDRGAA
ncbi:helix-turn-helix domain-containing protein [Demequina sp. TTPB684]|uniref:MerR family transcriptional regulator n=1 Tax=unclassified Demequina TaxID=2620311 RepID=UPI001CF267CA|nr:MULTISPECIES: helix-turn-helix domain-containing protein [unclassified Demequina]MCB2413682.1 helix-turn-helix domain-containing protein [Demequina sp. TTPB684]UPU87744.1 helix-turn-helix domain-containing protein [Demequina sp. TMPB413]